MDLVRALFVVLLVVATSLTSVMAASHGNETGSDLHAPIAKEMAGDQVHCCEDAADRSSGCSSLLALVTATERPHDVRPVSELAFAMRSTWLSVTEPSGPLDPPRSA